MRTKVVKLDAERIDPAKIKQAAALVDAGSLVAFPTETVYGIACKVRPESLTKLNNLKTRALISPTHCTSARRPRLKNIYLPSD